MANAKQHALVGAGVGLVGYGVYCLAAQKKFEVGECLAAGIAGGLIGLIPDILEPALNPHHRNFFHSYAAAGLLAYANKKALENPMISPENKARLMVGSLCYGSHLYLDSLTPFSLPVM